jgi:predicted AlkP superfamily pyrophosphatase or phosphodiesterase
VRSPPASARSLVTAGTDVTFVHLDDVDHAGHDSGFSPTNPEYLEAIEGVDALVASMVDAVLARPTIGEERWLVALTTDHGGSMSGHGALDAENRTVFVILTDLGGDPASLPATGVSQMDVGPSVLAHLGIEIDPTWMLDGVTR